jgi:hypothetical protein
MISKPLVLTDLLTFKLIFELLKRTVASIPDKGLQLPEQFWV